MNESGLTEPRRPREDRVKGVAYGVFGAAIASAAMMAIPQAARAQTVVTTTPVAYFRLWCQPAHYVLVQPQVVATRPAATVTTPVVTTERVDCTQPTVRTVYYGRPVTTRRVVTTTTTRVACVRPVARQRVVVRRVVTRVATID